MPRKPMTTTSSGAAHRAAPPAAPAAAGPLALVWGVGGACLLLAYAVVRLTPLALESFAYPWHAVHYALFAANLIFMAWTEGYRGFQCAYSPRLAARAHHLYFHATWWQALLAPLVCMGFVNATRRRLLTAWILLGAIIAVVALYRSLPQPWRGILDAGVVVGLAWGIAATLYCVWRVMRSGPTVDPEFG
jgi:hypothetical protein